MGSLASVTMVIVAFLAPAYIAKRLKHGEVCFDQNGKMIDDE